MFNLKRDLFNIFLFIIFFVGIGISTDTPWGFAVMALPFVIWFGAFLSFIHKSKYAAIAFWGGVAILSWQVALIAGLFFAILFFFKNKPPHTTEYNQAGGIVSDGNKEPIGEFFGSSSAVKAHNIYDD